MCGQVMPVMLVHPSLEMTRVRQADFGEAVNADMERYSRLAADIGYLDDTIASGDALLGWAPLPGGHEEGRHPRPPARVASLRGAAGRKRRTGAGPLRPWTGG
jgi:hypothetical protein